LSTDKSKKSLIKVSELGHSYGDREVLSIAEWHLIRGKHQLLLGPSGSGKTTLLSILTGLLRPTSGQVSFHINSALDISVDTISKHIASVFGVVFQDHHLITSLTLEENIRLAQQLSSRGLDNDWGDHLLEKMGLYARRKDKPDMLSRGEIQRAAIARAASTRPPILIADEPTSALDDKNSEQVMALLQTLSEEFGATLLVASHDKRIMSYFDERLELQSSEAAVA